MHKSSVNIFGSAARRSRARRGIAFAAITGLTVGLSLLASPASAYLNAGTFQLDGNAVSSATSPAATPTADDWDRVCYQVRYKAAYDTAITGGALAGAAATTATATATAACSTGLSTTSASAVAFVTEASNNSSIFTGGGSKDPQAIGNWSWKDGAGGLPDKDNLQNGFAARYSSTSSDILTFGSDRYDNSGDAQEGFWFFQQDVHQIPVPLGSSGSFSGAHENGDLLILSDFSNGGQVSTINVYKWDTGCLKAGQITTPGTTAKPCADANLLTLLTSTDANCANANAQAACGIVNPAATPGTAPWAFTDKSGTASNGYLNGEFFEGGINLADASIGLAGECFASFASETRSSTSTTATLKDFVVGGFGACGSTTVTTPQVAAAQAGGYTTISGPLSIVSPATSVTVRDSAVVAASGTSAAPTGTVTFHICGPTATNSTALCATGGTLVGTGTGAVALGSTSPYTANSADVTVSTPGRYCFRGDYSGNAAGVPASSDSAASECFIVKSPTTTVTEPRLATGGTAITSAVAVGTHVVDYALITGATGFGTPTGTVAFAICAPGGTTGAAGSEVCATGGTLLSGNPVTATAVSGETIKSEATSSPDVVANAVGVWCFRATYTPSATDAANYYIGSGDALHSECFTVKDSSSVTTAQDWLPNDSATVTATGGTALNGTLTFQLYTGDDCATTGSAVTGQLYSRTLTDATTLADRTKSTGNTTYTVAATSSRSWLVTFTSSDTNKVSNPSSSSCEKTSLTITN